MRDVSRTAVALEPSYQVLATLGTPGVVAALVGVYAEASRRVDLETSGTDASETAQRVYAPSRSGTEVSCLAFVDIVTLVSNLLEPFVTAAVVTAPSVDALVRANMLASLALVDIHARDAIDVQLVTRRTRTAVTSFCVVAVVLARRRVQSALVDVSTEKT